MAIPLELTALALMRRLGRTVLDLDDDQRRVASLRQNLIYAAPGETLV
jgi:hypothetical protein